MSGTPVSVNEDVAKHAPGRLTVQVGARSMRPRRARPRRVLALACVFVSAWLAIDAGWVHAKAGLAQWLLDRAWQRTVADGIARRPWPWADTRPVARLVAPRLQREQIVLAGDNGRTLAFGPGWAEASAAPGTPGTIVVSGHRDTHFAWLADLAPGDVVRLDGGAGPIDYVVTAMRVADSRVERVVLDGERHVLQLVTCWPFDAVMPGGPLRYVVTARPARASVAAQGEADGGSKSSSNSTSATSTAGSRTMS